ncbi:MAG: rhomboid family intramembrane serine protease, partial [Planctomycetota bacterium]
VGGAAAGAAHLLFSDAPVVGASGAIAAVTGAYFVLFPRTRIRTLVFFFIIGVFQIPAMWFIGFAVAKDVFFSAFGGGNVAYAAHLGGYLYGGVVAYALLATHLLEREVWDLFSVRRQARRRRLFKQVMQRQGAGVWEGAAARSTEAGQRERSSAASSRSAQRAAALRRRVREALARDDVHSALAAMHELHDSATSLASLGRDALLRLARAAYEQEEHALVRVLCEAFLHSRRDDAEAGRMALMLALSQMKVGDSDGAHKALIQARRRRLTDQERELADSLERELAATS